MRAEETVAAVETAGPVHRIEFDVDWPPGHVASYLLADPEPILFDAGMPDRGNEDALRAGLERAGYDPVDVAHVVVTHPHVDHIGLLDQLRSAGEPTVHAPAGYRRALDRSLAAVEAGIGETVRRAGIPAEIADYAIDRALERAETIRTLLPPESVDRWLEAGTRVSIGSRPFETIHTPGHQRDHLCLATDLADERVMFSGDVVIGPFRSAAVHAHFDPEQRNAVSAYRTALDRLAGRDVDRVYPGHGPPHADYAGAIERARAGLDRLLDRTHETIRPSGTHAGHVANERAEDPRNGPWLPEAIAALAALEREGRAESYREDGVRYYVPT